MFFLLGVCGHRTLEYYVCMTAKVFIICLVLVRVRVQSSALLKTLNESLHLLTDFRH
jgi:hypothetical protein